MTEHIVISGIGLEAPGGIDTLPAYWEALAHSKELLGPFPRDRGWPISRLLQLDRTEGWGPVADAGGFLTGAAEFDCGFFGLTPREAVAADPQQRAALRVAWRALEHAGINPGRLAGDDVGVFMGASLMEYGPRSTEVNEYNGYRVVGTALGANAGRISHGLGLVGPSVSVDTACASSLTALHQAVAAIRNDECEWALAGAVCVMGSAGAFFEFAKINALAPDGHLRAYSASASGTVWGEGAGVVVVEPESRARRLGHRIYGRVLATRVNHNGNNFGAMNTGIMVPSSDSQEALMRKTLQAAGISPDRIGLIEGHGTGTPVGDPLEVTALHAVYGESAARLGSVKTNVGHAQAAAGMLGLIKVLLCGAEGAIAPSLFADDPTTAIDWSATGLRLASALEPWAARDGVRHAAVSSFGVAGTNAHAIVEMPVMEDELD